MQKIVKKVNFDVSTFCNHKCTFCSNSDKRTIKAQTSLSDFIKVMDNVTNYIDIQELGLSAKGEVLINKDLEDIIKSCKDRYKINYIYFSTNGALLDNSRAISLLDSGIDSIKFSINALTKDEYKRVHKVDDFDLVIENLKNLIELKKSKFKNLKILISSVTNISYDDLERGFKNILGDSYSEIFLLSRYELSFTSKDIVNENQDIIKSNCKIPFDEIYINSNGTLGFCCKDYFDEVNFGSLIDSDFMKLYNSKEYEDIRVMHKSGVFPDNHICKKCLLFGK